MKIESHREKAFRLARKFGVEGAKEVLVEFRLSLLSLPLSSVDFASTLEKYRLVEIELNNL